MGHVVDKVVFHLRQLLLPESQDDCAHEGDKQNEGEDKRRYHEAYGVKDVVALGREVDLEVVHLVFRVVGEEGLDEHRVLVAERWLIACRAVDDCSHAVDYREFIGE